MLAAVVGGVIRIGITIWPRALPAAEQPDILQPVIRDGRVDVMAPGYLLLAHIGVYDDELFAYLMFDHYRSLRQLRGGWLYLTSTEHNGRPEYRISLASAANFTDAIGELVDLKQAHLIEGFEWRLLRSDGISAYERDTTIFIRTWTAPAKIALTGIGRTKLQRYVRRFIRFKSMTDPRVEHSMDPIASPPSPIPAALAPTPSPLTKDAASRLAADIISVADFYHVPLELLLSIGAMENNYMNVPGDLHNTAWKDRPDPGDIVLRRRHGKVLVRNDSRGVWQITRESLRYAHRLYLADKRDYSLLAERLRPPEHLDIDNVSSDQLTTYAGLLLRDLLDHFGGDVAQAAGAYNGGVTNPNEGYARGVQQIAEYARRVLQNAAARNTAASEEAADTRLNHRITER